MHRSLPWSISLYKYSFSLTQIHFLSNYYIVSSINVETQECNNHVLSPEATDVFRRSALFSDWWTRTLKGQALLRCIGLCERPIIVPMCGVASVCAWYINTMFNTDVEINSVHVSGFINEIVAYSFLP